MLPLVMSTPLAASYAALTVGGAKCGTKICEIYQYCSKFHTGCEDCSLICDADGHNFEEETCFKDCQSKFNYYNNCNHYNASQSYSNLIFINDSFL